MKSLRRSLHKDSHSPTATNISTPLTLPAVSKPSSSHLPPKSVIRANEPYRPQGPQELGFQKGDFFYVIREVDAGGKSYFEAHNPVTGARGLVPRRCFDEINKVTPRGSVPIGPVPGPTQQRLPPPPQMPRSAPPLSSQPPMSQQQQQQQQQPRTRTFYAVVQHDFIAERADELDARAGDPISVVAQSNREWFVAKPIGRLGGPGLIPVAFVEIRDPLTGEAVKDIDALMSRGELPRVEDWKKKTMDYKASSIALGVIDDLASNPESPFQATSFPMSDLAGSGMADRFRQDPPSPGTPPPEEDPWLPPGILMTGEVASFHFEEDYWFSINAVYQPDSGVAQQLVLYRIYDDFYEFQISLLDAFPREAGREPGADRILPYMPGPVQQVDDIITAQRRVELDEYLKDLCNLRNHGAAYILRHDLVRAFISPRAGDIQKDVKGGLAPSRPVNRAPSPATREPDNYASQYEQRVASPNPRRDSPPPQIPHPYATSRPESGQSNYGDAPNSGYSGGGLHSSIPNTSSSFGSPSGFSSLSPDYSTPPSSTGPLSGKYNTNSYSGSTGSRHSGGSAGASTNHSNPPISSTNSAPAFLKIKIFDRQTDDLVALRLPPRVTHQQLMEKTRERLGNDVSSLSYRVNDSSVGNGGFVDIVDDADLRDWVETADKLVLYAD